MPPLPGGLTFGCFSFENGPLLLQVAGFATEQDALDFSPVLSTALRIAALDSAHSMTPSDGAPVVSTEAMFDGRVPTVTLTAAKAKPYFLAASMQNGLHISVLSKSLSTPLVAGTPAKVNAQPELALALELFSDSQFAGERHAQFIVLMTALEILVSNTSGKGKRGAVIALVKNALGKAGHTDPKTAGKLLDSLYVARNALVHESKPVSDAQLNALTDIVRATLKALVA